MSAFSGEATIVQAQAVRPILPDEVTFLAGQAQAVGGRVAGEGDQSPAVSFEFPDESSVDAFLWRVRLVPMEREVDEPSALALNDAGTRDRPSRTVASSALVGSRQATLRDAIRGFAPTSAAAPRQSPAPMMTASAANEQIRQTRFETLNLEEFETDVEPLPNRRGYRVVMARRSS
jgi:hypothetical protein